MNTPIPEDKLVTLKQAIFNGEKIAAIKFYREVTGEGLREAKIAVEKLEAELRAASPEKFTSPPSKGCLGVVAGVCAVVILAVLCFAFAK